MSKDQIKTFNTSIFDRVLNGEDIGEKIRLARQLANLACDPESSALERDAIVPTLVRLTGDPVKKVRANTAKFLSSARGLHPDVVFSIVADDEDIALPFLAQTQSLDRLRALTIVRVGDKPRQMVLASRGDLHSDVVSKIVEKCDFDVCGALLDNKSIELVNEQYRRLYVRFRDVGEIAERLLARPDLPLEVRILQAKRTSETMHQMMAERGWLAFDKAENIIADSQEKTLLRILVSAREGEITSLIPFLSKKELLTPSLVLRAACRGYVGVVGQILAYLSSTPVAKVQRIIDERATMGLKSIYNKASLPKNCFHIVRAAVDVTADLKELPTRAGQAHFGPQLIEYVTTRYGSITTGDKSVLLKIISDLGDEPTRQLAKRLVRELKQAA